MATVHRLAAGGQQPVSAAIEWNANDNAGRPAQWLQLIEQIVQLEELIADLKADPEGQSALLVRELDDRLKQERSRLKAIDIACSR